MEEIRDATRVVRSACRMCHGVCQVLVHLDGDRVVKVTGDRESPTSAGYLCPKGAASPELLTHPDRIVHPLRRAGRRGENRWERISWDEALDEVASRLGDIKEESGAEYFALMQGTSRTYTDLATRFANAFGTPNFTNIGHVCFVPRIVASAFSAGSILPPVSDVHGFGGTTPACILFWGSNITGLGSVHGLCGGIVQKAIKDAKKIIVVDPRRTGPARKADQWLQLRPGTDGALALAMLHVIIAEDLVDQDFVQQYTKGFERLVDHVREFTPDWAADITRIAPDAIRAAARTYATTAPATILWGSAIDMSVCSFQTARSLMILRAITGNLDIPGGDVFSVAPEGVRMKSQFVNRERSGMLFLPLAKHARVLDGQKRPRGFLRKHFAAAAFSVLDRIVQTNYDRIVSAMDRRDPGGQFAMLKRLRAPKYPLLPNLHLPTLWESINTGLPYRVRALWIMGANPLLTAPDSLRVEQALQKIEFLVVSDLFHTPTTQFADIVLPAAMWLEQDDVVNNLKQWCITARPKVAQTGEVRDDREVMIALAHRLGLDRAFPWKDYRAYLDDVLKETGFSFEEFCETGVLAGDMRYQKFKTNGFQTPSGKFEIYSNALRRLGVSPLPVYREPPVSPVSTPDLAREFPLILTAGMKSRYFFHSEGRQIRSLRRRSQDPVAELHPSTAESLGVREKDWVWIETMEGRVRMRARLSTGLAPDVVSAEPAWWFPEEEPPEYGWKRSSVNLLFGAPQVDPDIGSEPLRSTLCRVVPEVQSS